VSTIVEFKNAARPLARGRPSPLPFACNTLRWFSKPILEGGTKEGSKTAATILRRSSLDERRLTSTYAPDGIHRSAVAGQSTRAFGVLLAAGHAIAPFSRCVEQSNGPVCVPGTLRR
jgi:hypothetical protein